MQVMSATRARGGEVAVLQTLQRARELYRNRLHENAAADELASLFAECAIAEAQPANPSQPQATPPQPQPFDVNAPSTLLDAVANDTSILAMSGRKQIMLDAFSDGSSFICLKCGGLVSNDRKDEHLAYWCGKC